jgi:hypothetical protein
VSLTKRYDGTYSFGSQQKLIVNFQGITLAQTCKSHPSATQFYILSFTASAGKLEALKALIEVGGFDPDITDADNASPIMFAAAEGTMPYTTIALGSISKHAHGPRRSRVYREIST